MSLDLATRIRNVTAVLGPTNTGKTHLAIERMLGHDSGLIGLPLRLLAREVYDKIAARVGADQRRADHRRGEDQAGAPALLGVHGRGDAARCRRRFPRHRRGPARRRSRSAATSSPTACCTCAASRRRCCSARRPCARPSAISFPAPTSSRARACPSSPTPARRRSRGCRRARRWSPSRPPRSTPSPS